MTPRSNHNIKPCHCEEHCDAQRRKRTKQSPGRMCNGWGRLLPHPLHCVQGRGRNDSIGFGGDMIVLFHTLHRPRPRPRRQTQRSICFQRHRPGGTSVHSVAWFSGGSDATTGSTLSQTCALAKGWRRVAGRRALDAHCNLQITAQLLARSAPKCGRHRLYSSGR